MEDDKQLTPEQHDEVEQRSPPESKVVYAAVAKQGDDELDRPTSSLFWSGIAAGLGIILSVVAEAGISGKLPPEPWREAVSSIGYSLGFLVVILGRLQLFTEHTVVAILPLARDPTAKNWKRVTRLWIVVFVGNMIGAAAASALAVFGHVNSDELLRSMLEVSSKLLEKTPMQVLLQGIPAGFLIGSVAWINSAMDDGKFWVVLTLTSAIALGGFTHVVAGAAEAFLLAFSGQANVAWALFGFILPALVGNVIGGTGLFAMLAHAQVKEEV